ncbi:MAG: SpoIIE family protein phosphatase [Bacteroidaceae bacterium]|nr:SpoIIE family protein phosphatase [Bacteroidaceae bacterium]
MSKLRDFILSLRKRKGLLIVIVAVLLLELLSAAQYYYTHNLLENELEKYAEMELTTKAIITKRIVEDSERTLKSHIMEVKYNLSTPDSMFNIVAQITKYTPNLKGCGISFIPGYYKGRLFEPYALRTDTGIVRLQIAGDKFDYTKDGFYRDIMEKKANSWVGPYDDIYLKTRLVSYAVPIYEFTGDTVAVFGVDIDTKSLGDTLNYRHIYPSSFDLLLTEEGELIAEPTDTTLRDEVQFVLSLINDSTVERRLSSNGRSHIIDFDTRNRDGAIFYASMRGIPHWQIAVICYDDEVYGSLLELRYRLLLFSLLAFGILLYLVRRYAQDEQKLRIQTLEQERMAGELRIASNIQQALLPEEETSMKDIDDIRVEGRLIPAKAVGGDLYNAFVRDGKLFFCIGDVSGKGIPSALIMAITQALFRNVATREDNPAHIMKRLNETACRNNKTNIFVTLFIGVLDLPTGHLRYCNAGHELPLIGQSEVKSEKRKVKNKSNNAVDNANPDYSLFTYHFSLIDAKPNLPIGLFEDFDYKMQTMQMRPDTTLFLYTDGLTEARNAKGKLFGRDRVGEMIAGSGTLSPKQIVESTIRCWQDFIGSTEQSDDLTLLAIHYSPADEHNILDRAITLRNDTKEVEALGAFVKGVAEDLSLSKTLTGKLRLAVEEAVVNVMEYAYPQGKTGEIGIRAISNGHRLQFVISDSGRPFNPTEVSAADTTLSAEERPIGGLGILLVRELMDSINYERIDGKNVLTLSKRNIND